MPSKVHAIAKFPTPTTIKKLQEFCGMVNFYHRFIPRLAYTMTPLYNGLKNKPKTLCWNKEMESAFKLTKEALMNAATLTYPSPRGRLILTTDASDIAIGAVLEQELGDIRKPFGFFSRKLSDREKDTQR